MMWHQISAQPGCFQRKKKDWFASFQVCDGSGCCSKHWPTDTTVPECIIYQQWQRTKSCCLCLFFHTSSLHTLCDSRTSHMTIQVHWTCICHRKQEAETVWFLDGEEEPWWYKWIPLPRCMILKNGYIKWLEARGDDDCEKSVIRW